MWQVLIFFVMYVFCYSQSTTGDIILPKTLFAKVQNVHVKKGSGYKQCFFIVIMNSIVSYIMWAQCRWYNEIVVPNCKKRVAGENLLFHLELASDCKIYLQTSLPQLKYICKLNTAQVCFVKRVFFLGNLILEVSLIFHKVICVIMNGFSYQLELFIIYCLFCIYLKLTCLHNFSTKSIYLWIDIRKQLATIFSWCFIYDF